MNGQKEQDLSLGLVENVIPWGLSGTVNQLVEDARCKVHELLKAARVVGLPCQAHHLLTRQTREINNPSCEGASGILEAQAAEMTQESSLLVQGNDHYQHQAMQASETRGFAFVTETCSQL